MDTNRLIEINKELEYNKSSLDFIRLNRKAINNYRQLMDEKVEKIIELENEFFEINEKLNKVVEPEYKGDQDERDNEKIILEQTVDISKITEDNNLNEYHEKRDREEEFSTKLLEMFLQWVTLMVAIASLSQIIKEII